MRFASNPLKTIAAVVSFAIVASAGPDFQRVLMGPSSPQAAAGHGPGLIECLTIERQASMFYNYARDLSVVGRQASSETSWTECRRHVADATPFRQDAKYDPARSCRQGDYRTTASAVSLEGNVNEEERSLTHCFAVIKTRSRSPASTPWPPKPLTASRKAVSSGS